MYTGLTGSLQIENSLGLYKPVAYVSGWSVEDKSEVIETTKIGRTHKDAYTGFQSWSASADGAAVFEDIGEDGHEALFKTKHLGKKVRLRMYLNDTKMFGVNGEDTGTYFEGEGFIESLSVDLSAEDKGNISVAVRGSGPLGLYVNGKDVKTNQPPSDRFFKLKIDAQGNLCVIAPDDSPFAFEDIDENGWLKVIY